jgi:hypothetical protein
VYNITTDTWSKMSKLNEEREDITLCIVENKYLYAIGNSTARGKRFKS